MWKKRTLTLSRATAQYCAAAAINYKEVTFYLTINVFWSQKHIVQRKSVLVKFAGIIYKERLPATRKRFIPQNTAI